MASSPSQQGDFAQAGAPASDMHQSDTMGFDDNFLQPGMPGSDATGFDDFPEPDMHASGTGTLGVDDNAHSGMHHQSGTLGFDDFAPSSMPASDPTLRSDNFFDFGAGEYKQQTEQINASFMLDTFRDFSSDDNDFKDGTQYQTGMTTQMHGSAGAGAGANGVPFQDMHYQAYMAGPSTQQGAILPPSDDPLYTNGYTKPTPRQRSPPRHLGAGVMQYQAMHEGPAPQEPVAVGKSIAKVPCKDVLDIRKYLTAIIMKPTLSKDQKLYIIKSIPVFVLNEVFLVIKPREGPVLPSSPPPPPPRALLAPRPEHPEQQMLLPSPSYPVEFGLTEDNYLPLIHHEESSNNPDDPAPIYPAFMGYFQGGEEARRHRRRARIPPKSGAPDVDRVKRYGRQYWVQRLYEAMIDISDLDDGDTSIHRHRLTNMVKFDPMDLEATAHHIFDGAIAVHERGWNRPTVYHKKVVRGKLMDISEKSLEKRLSRICLVLRQKKATVDDAVRGGVTLALLCDNPEARGFTKSSNNSGNTKRGIKLKLINDQLAKKKAEKNLVGDEEQDSDGDE